MATEPPEGTRAYQQIHIDVARNATDDFNPFHDGNKWDRIQGNPFGGPIVLGFQLECLAEHLVTRLRGTEHSQGDAPAYPFRNYQFTFAGVLRPDEAFTAAVKPTVYRTDSAGSSQAANRVAMRKSDALVLLGHIRDTATPLALPDEAAPLAPGQTLKQLEDRGFLSPDGWFHKRKFMTNSNAKNLLSGSLAPQADYFDELEDRVNFPDMFPAALVSCALLEKAHATGHDFYRNPLVYTAHHISVDQRLARGLRSADTLHILVSPVESIAAESAGLGRSGILQQRYRCLGLLTEHHILFRADVALAPLAAITQPQARPAP